ncbi:MAG: FxLYD domain-containing protein [Anaerolineales bacterium]
MKRTGRFASVILLTSLAGWACLSSTPTGEAPDGNSLPAGAGEGTATRAPTRVPSPTTEQLLLEIIQSQVWADPDGNVRVNVLLRNPYEYPVEFQIRPRASLLNGAGEFIRDDELILFDGIGGSGLILPGETIAAYGCFTCEEALLTEEWDSVRFVQRIQDATGSWNYSTEVEAAAVHVSFEGDSPIFDVTGTVKNNGESALDRISVRVFVYNGDILVGAGEASAYEVGPGASVPVSGYGLGESPDGPYEFEFTVLGVNY